MEVLIKRITLQNFKGVRHLNINFSRVTNITGDNGTGKTSVFDAFTWLMFGKNSEDSKDFNIKTLDAFNQPIHKLEHEVSATLSVDGRDMNFKRLYKEKWEKKRGESQAEFKGHETLYFVDDVPLSQKEYQARVDFVLNESIAKMITSPTYFNTLKWQDRRQVLENMAGTISNSDIASGNEAFTKLLAEIGNDKIADFKKKQAAKKAKIKETLDYIPSRIAEAKYNMPMAHDWQYLESQVQAKQAGIKEVEDAIEDKAKQYREQLEEIREKETEKHKLQLKYNEVKLNAGQYKKLAVEEIENRLRSISSTIKADKEEMANNERALSTNNQRINKLNDDNARLRADWAKENEKTLVIDEHQFTCPTCKQNLPDGEIEQTRERLTTNFNEEKAKALNKITTTGKANADEIDKILASNLIFEADITEIKQRIENNTALLNELYKQKQEKEAEPITEPAELKLLQQQLDAISIPAAPSGTNPELKAKKDVLTREIDELKTKLAGKEQIAKIEARIKELEDEESKLALELAVIEQSEFTLAEFSKARIEQIESRINSKFKLVKFKMFEQQINGGEVECCECMVNGVPYADVNTAGKIAAGIDIINALTEYHNINAPVFIDNRESIVRLPECKSQIINLIVKEGEPLKVEAVAAQAVMNF